MTRIRRPKSVTTIKDKIKDIEARLQTIEISLRIYSEQKINSDSRMGKIPTT